MKISFPKRFSLFWCLYPAWNSVSRHYSSSTKTRYHSISTLPWHFSTPHVVQQVKENGLDGQDQWNLKRGQHEHCFTTYSTVTTNGHTPAEVKRAEKTEHDVDGHRPTREDVASTFEEYAQLIHASQRPLSVQLGDGAFLDKDEPTGLLADLKTCWHQGH